MIKLRLILFLICSISAVNSIFAIETAENLLDRCADKIAKAPSITFDFVLSYNNNSSDCELIISRDKYRLSSQELEVWYDGKTQWAYSVSDKEVSITEPVPEELLEINPFVIISNYKKNYTYRRLSGDNNEIELVPKGKMANIRKAVVFIDGKSFLPSKLIITMSNGRTLSVSVKSCVEGKALPSSLFKYNEKKYPADSIIDLR